LNDSLAEVCAEGLKQARAMNIPVSVDLNYRSKLWKYGKDPVDVMPSLVEYCHTIMGNIWSASTLLNNPLNDDVNNFHQKDQYLSEAKRSADALLQRFTNCKQVAYTFRFDEPQGIRYYGSLIDEFSQYNSKEYISDHVIDKVGSGDCFMAGLIHSHFNSYSNQETIEFATAAAFSKLHVNGDSTTLNVEEINNTGNEN
jgi:2-dehydro-3-deoxygluconokinase